jgi:hypothetical protein
MPGTCESTRPWQQQGLSRQVARRQPQSADELAEALKAACDPRAWTLARASEWWKLRSE